jgi:osomolarity two-component system response regulator SKN7
MPHLDGISATAAIKEVALWMPIIAISSNIRADNIDMYFRCGVDAAPYLKRSH